MKSLEKLRESYEIQKRSFEEAETRRLNNVRQELETLKAKRDSLSNQITVLQNRLNSRKEFEDFESFRKKAASQSSKQES